MSRTYKDSPKSRKTSNNDGRGRRRNISVRGVQRDQPDYRRLGRAVIELALAEAEAEARQTANQPPVGTESPGD
jgi:hypothetical protein